VIAGSSSTPAYAGKDAKRHAVVSRQAPFQHAAKYPDHRLKGEVDDRQQLRRPIQRKRRQRRDEK
jgi:hypothetical protein